MNHYVDLHLLPDPEFPAPLLMNALFSKLHRALVFVKSKSIGISFPEHAHKPIGLGTVLRLHGELENLSSLLAQDWLHGMRNYCTIGPTCKAPTETQHRMVRRVQVHSSAERARRRLMARKGITEQQAQEAIPTNFAEKLSLPYVTLSSRSTGQQFRLFIEHGPLLDNQHAGIFNSYGLSTSATVPWF